MRLSEDEYAALLARRQAQTPAHVPDEPEARFLSRVRALARQCGFKVYHTHRSDRSDKGFPDLVLVKPGRLVIAELKSARGKLSHEQVVWLEHLRHSVPGVEVYEWRSTDWDEIVTTLT